ncbi:short-chain dehydrogenase [Aspergillus crustosus]
MSSSYSFQTTGEQVAADSSASIANKVVLITGVSPGSLGAEFAVTISKHSPALIILANRDTTRATETANKIKEASPNVATRVLKLDLASQKQIREAAAEVNNYSEKKIHVLVNNAGIMAVPHKLTADGIESQFGTNHIGHFLFTNLIINKLLASDGANSSASRVVNVASMGYRLSWVRFWDHNFDEGKAYVPWVAYGQAKTANMLFSIALAKRGLISVSLNPGQIPTNLANSIGEQGVPDLLGLDYSQGHTQFKVEDWSNYFKTIEQGIATHVYAAFHDDISLDKNNGAFLDDSHPVPAEEIYAWGRDPVGAESLWELSEKIVGEKFDF